MASKGMWHWKLELQVVHSPVVPHRALFALPDLQVPVAFDFFCSSSVVADSTGSS